MRDTLTDKCSADAHEIHREAYNAAFYELGLSWHWDADTYRNLLPDSAGSNDRIRVYLETRQPHLLKVYDAAFLINAIQVAKARCYDAMSACGRNVAPNVNWAEIQRGQVGV
jgi:hypothetical protein